MKRPLWICAAVSLLLASALVFPVPSPCAQDSSKPQISNLDRAQVEEILKQIHDAVKKNYYDPSFHGIDLDTRYVEFRSAVKNARKLSEAFDMIATYLSALHDSHTYFIPPLVTSRFDYGFRMQMVGGRCFITEVRPGTDAASKIHPGDEVLKVDTYDVTRSGSLDLEYYLNVLSPQRDLDLLLRAPDGAVRTEHVVTKFVAGGDVPIQQLVADAADDSRHFLRDRSAEVGDALIWKIPVFSMTHEEVDRVIGKADKHSALVIDLRGNPGGLQESLIYLTSCFFDHNVTIATPVARKHQDALIAKPHGRQFTGKLFVLVDSRSASASELFARTIQLNRRGTIIGDLTAGAVMEGRFYPFHTGMDVQAFYAVAITSADLIMSDGKSLEKAGVTPDVLLVPTAADLAAGNDPVLAQAVQLAGAKLDPSAAGKLFPFEWMPLQP